MKPAAQSTPAKKSKESKKRSADLSVAAARLPKQKRARAESEGEDAMDDEGDELADVTMSMDLVETPKVYKMAGPKEFYSIGSLDEGKLGLPLYDFDAVRALCLRLETHDVIVALPLQPGGEITGAAVRAIEATFCQTAAVADRQRFGTGISWSVPNRERLWEVKSKVTQTIWVDFRPYYVANFPRAPVLPHAERDGIASSVFWSFVVPDDKPELPESVLALVMRSGRVTYAEVWRGYTAEGKAAAEWFLRVYQPSSKLLKQFKLDDFTLFEDPSVKLKHYKRCVFCLRVDMHGGRHSAADCGILRQLNGHLDDRGLQEAIVTSKLKVKWVDASKAYDVQESLKMLLMEHQTVAQQLSSVEQRVTALEAENLALKVQGEGGKGKEGKKGKGKAEEKVTAAVPVKGPTPGSSKGGSKQKYYNKK
ncbi:hypothetical protein EWM64_g2556 [Hericium alpestre]|uniref:Uncharacterized protein n=1 Tax=Hericium alpestre TaxID=135208 RepID=A0A4Z0A411_9AGAM|nr:hypothetical protein EWM64_g2556 [Hericium alpestre]